MGNSRLSTIISLFLAAAFISLFFACLIDAFFFRLFQQQRRFDYYVTATCYRNVMLCTNAAQPYY